MTDLSQLSNLIEYGGVEAFGKFYSIYPGIVESFYDPEGRGRVLVSVEVLGHPLPMQYYAHYVSPFCGNRVDLSTGTPLDSSPFGFYFPPEPGSSVLVAFQFGNLEAPIVLGGWWLAPGRKLANSRVPKEFRIANVSFPPTTRGIRSPVGHLIRFEDSSAYGRDQELLLRSSAGAELSFNDRRGSIRLSSSGSPAQYLDSNGDPARVLRHQLIGVDLPTNQLELKTAYNPLGSDEDITRLFYDLDNSSVEMSSTTNISSLNKRDIRGLYMTNGRSIVFEEKGGGAFANIVVGTGDGSTRFQLEFRDDEGQLQEVIPGTLVISVTSGGSIKRAYDQGGLIKGFIDDQVLASTIDYINGSADVAFKYPPDSGSSILASYRAIGRLDRVSDSATDDGVIRLESKQDPSSSAPAYFQIVDAGTSDPRTTYIEARTPGLQCLRIEDTSPNGPGKITLTTAAGYQVVVDEVLKQITINTASNIIQMDDNTGAISIAATAGPINVSTATMMTETVGAASVETVAGAKSITAAGITLNSSGATSMLSTGLVSRTFLGGITELVIGAVASVVTGAVVQNVVGTLTQSVLGIWTIQATPTINIIADTINLNKSGETPKSLMTRDVISWLTSHTHPVSGTTAGPSATPLVEVDVTTQSLKGS